MFSYFLPKHIRQGRNLLKDARKMLAYKRDLWSEATISDYESNLRKIEQGLRERDKVAIEESAHALDTLCSANLPPPKDAAMVLYAPSRRAAGSGAITSPGRTRTPL